MPKDHQDISAAVATTTALGLASLCAVMATAAINDSSSDGIASIMEEAIALPAGILSPLAGCYGYFMQSWVYNKDTGLREYFKEELPESYKSLGSKLFNGIRNICSPCKDPESQPILNA